MINNSEKFYIKIIALILLFDRRHFRTNILYKSYLIIMRSFVGIFVMISIIKSEEIYFLEWST